jgi:ABC-type phosphate transport system permease subunit
MTQHARDLGQTVGLQMSSGQTFPFDKRLFAPRETLQMVIENKFEASETGFILAQSDARIL